MKVTILGSGSLPFDLRHLGASYLLEINNKKILIDAGPGTMVRLLEIGLNITDLDYVFITHFHCDHTSDLFPMLLFYKMSIHNMGKKLPDIQVYGPAGTIDFLNKVHFLHHHRRESFDWRGVGSSEILDRKDFGDFVVTPFRMNHGDMAYAYRFEADGKVVVFSGDTMMCDNIVEAARDADIFVCDCSLPKDAEPKGHLISSQVGEIALKAKPKRLILSHITEKFIGKDLVSEVREKFDGEVILGKDLMSFEV